MASTSITPLTVILTSDENWHVWIQRLETRATETDVWKYIDPAVKETELPKLTVPVEPTLSSVHQPTNNTPVTISDLTPIEYSNFQELRAEYREELRIYRNKEASLAGMRPLIQASIYQDLITHTE